MSLESVCTVRKCLCREKFFVSLECVCVVNSVCTARKFLCHEKVFVLREGVCAVRKCLCR